MFKSIFHLVALLVVWVPKARLSSAEIDSDLNCCDNFKFDFIIGGEDLDFIPVEPDGVDLQVPEYPEPIETINVGFDKVIHNVSTPELSITHEAPKEVPQQTSTEPKSTTDPEIPTISPFLPNRLLNRTLNCVTKAMDKPVQQRQLNTRELYSSTITHFKQLIKRLQADFTEDMDFYGVRISKESLEQAMERIHAFKQSGFGKRVQDCMFMFKVITGNDQARRSRTECIGESLRVLLAHAMAIYGDIPGIQFRDNGDFLVEGCPFPTPQQIQAVKSKLYRAARGKKRKHADDGNPPKEKKRKKPQNTLALRDHLFTLHNAIASHYDTETLPNRTKLPLFFDSLHSLLHRIIDEALLRKRLHKHPIHDTEPVTKKMLLRLRQSLGLYKQPSSELAKSYLSMLTGEVCTQAKKDIAEVWRELTRQVAAIAFTVIRRLDGVEYEDGELVFS